MGSSHAKPIASIEDPMPVFGLAVLDKKLYVLREKPTDQLYVYDTADYKLQYTIGVPDLKFEKYNDLTECVTENCLFLSDFGANCIRKVEPKPKGEESKVSKFVDVYEPTGLSITPEGHLLVAHNPNKLVEFDVKTGEKVCEVELQVQFPLHALKRSDGQYVVSHTDQDLSRVCRFGADGHFRHCYGGKKGSGDDQLDYPCSLALCDDFYVIVADNDNNRVLLLNGWLDYVHTLVDFREPHRLWFDRDPQSRRLYVGESIGNGCIKVFQTM